MIDRKFVENLRPFCVEFLFYLKHTNRKGDDGDEASVHICSIAFFSGLR